MNTFRRLVAVVVALLAFAPAASAKQGWYWSTERASSVVVHVPDSPRGCLAARRYHRWVIYPCVRPEPLPAHCVGVGTRTISPTADVYLYRAFNCTITTTTFTVPDDRIGVSALSKVRIQVTSRFTAHVTWRDLSWTATIQPTD
jgi:hypothetical protein